MSLLSKIIKYGSIVSGVFLCSFLFTSAATCNSIFVGGTSVCYGNGYTGGFTAHTVLLGEGINALSTTSPSNSGFVLTSNGISSDPTFQPSGSAGSTLITAGTGISTSTSSGGAVLVSNTGVISLGNGVGTTCSGTNPGTCNVNTTQNITNLSNLTTNGFVQTSAGNGTLSAAALTNGQITTALGFTPSSFAYPFQYFNNTGTSSTLLLVGSTTIGNGTLGLTVSGSATTTGTGYFAGNVGIGSTTPVGTLSIVGAPASIGPTSPLIFASSTNTSGSEIILSQNGDRKWSILACGPGNGICGTNANSNFVLRDASPGVNQVRFTIDGSGNIGIGSTSPGSLLSVGNTGWNFYNNATSSDASANGGLNITSGCYAIGGVCIGGGSGTNYFTNSGANTYLSTGTLLGVGTTTPWGVLSVNGQYQPTISNTTPPLFAIGSTTLSTGTSTAFLVDNRGWVGVASTSPGALLAVSGTGNNIALAARGSGTGDIIDAYLAAGGAPAVQVTQFGVMRTLSVQGAGTYSITSNALSNVPLTLSTTGSGGTVTGDLLDFNRNGGTNYSIFNSIGKLGLGTTSTPWELDVGTSSAGTLFNNGQLGITDSSGATNSKHILLSNEGGNLYIGSTTDAYATSTTPIISLLNNGTVAIPKYATSTGSVLGVDTKGNIIATTSIMTGGYQLFTSTGTFTVPNNVTQLYVRLCGAGGGGGGGPAGSGATGGGGGGGCTEGMLTVTAGQVITATVGAAGVSGTSNNPGATGGTTTFSTLTATGGAGGPTVNSGVASYGGAGGVGSGGAVNLTGATGGIVISSSASGFNNQRAGNGGAAPFFGGEGSGTNYGVGANGVTTGNNTNLAGAGAIILQW